MSEDLAAFVRERLDEEREAAERTQPGPWIAVPATMPGEMEIRHQMPDGRPDVAAAVATTHGLYCSGADAEHIARYNPARVLAEVEAKRLQIEQTFRYEATIDGEWGCCHEAESIARGECPAIPVDGIRMLRLLALPYAEHSGYRSEWSPDE